MHFYLSRPSFKNSLIIKSQDLSIFIKNIRKQRGYFRIMGLAKDKLLIGEMKMKNEKVEYFMFFSSFITFVHYKDLVLFGFHNFIAKKQAESYQSMAIKGVYSGFDHLSCFMTDKLQLNNQVGRKTAQTLIPYFIFRNQINFYLEEEDTSKPMSTAPPQQFGFYHSESKTFFYFETEDEFKQFVQLYQRYETQVSLEMEEINRPNLDTFNTVFEELNSSSYDSVEELRELDF